MGGLLTVLLAGAALLLFFRHKRRTAKRTAVRESQTGMMVGPDESHNSSSSAQMDAPSATTGYASSSDTVSDGGVRSEPCGSSAYYTGSVASADFLRFHQFDSSVSIGDRDYYSGRYGVQGEL